MLRRMECTMLVPSIRPGQAAKRWIVCLVLFTASHQSWAGLDHELAYDNSGIWNRNVQLALQYSAIAVGVGGALWLGNDTELGHTFWQSVDSEAIAAVAA